MGKKRKIKNKVLKGKARKKNQMDITTYQHIGKRPYQEDRFLVLKKFANFEHFTLCLVCDGHGGFSVSAFLIHEYPKQLCDLFLQQAKRTEEEKKERLITMLGQALENCIHVWDEKCFGKVVLEDDVAKEAFYKNRDEGFWSKYGLEAGSTFVCMLIDMHKQRAHVVHLGDSRATWIVDECLIGQTVDHAVKRKMEPIKGFKFINTDGRLQGDLAMSRSVGDNTQELYGVVSRKYDSLTIDFKNKSFRSVIASDGLFDVRSTHNVLYECFANAEEIAVNALEAMKEADPTQTMFEDNVSIIYIKHEVSEVIKSQKTQQKEDDTQLIAQMSALMSGFNDPKKKIAAAAAAMSMSPDMMMAAIRTMSEEKTGVSKKKKKSSLKRTSSTKPNDEVYKKFQQGNMTLKFNRRKSSKKRS